MVRKIVKPKIIIQILFFIFPRLSILQQHLLKRCFSLNTFLYCSCHPFRQDVYRYANRRRHTSALTDQITPRIITIFYHLRTIRVNQRNHITLRHVDDIFNSQAVMVIGELRVGSGLHHACQHAPGFPCKRPTVIGQRIANQTSKNGVSEKAPLFAPQRTF